MNTSIIIDNTLITLTTATTEHIHVSLFNIPLEVPDQVIADKMREYGDILGSFRVTKTLRNRRIQNGTRIYIYTKIENKFRDT